MKKPAIAFLAVATVLAAGYVRFASGQETSAQTGKLIHVSSDKVAYKEMMPGVSRAIVWGDPDKGAHRTFTKFRPGHDAGMHSHTNDVSLVVLKGAYLYRDDAGDKRVAAGEFMRIPGGHKHWSGGDKTEGALFYQEGAGKFDLVPAK